MTLTAGLALLGAVTGVVGLLWQIWSHRLTGGRVKIIGFRDECDGGCVVGATVVNMGRLDVVILGYTVYLEPIGMYGRKAWWRIKLILRTGILNSRRVLSLPRPFAAFYHGEEDAVLPLVLEGGKGHTFPNVEFTWPQEENLKVRVAVHTATGRIVRGSVFSRVSEPTNAYIEPPPDEWGPWSVDIPNPDGYRAICARSAPNLRHNP